MLLLSARPMSIYVSILLCISAKSVYKVPHKFKYILDPDIFIPLIIQVINPITDSLTYINCNRLSTSGCTLGLPLDHLDLE